MKDLLGEKILLKITGRVASSSFSEVRLTIVGTIGSILLTEAYE